MSAQKKPITQVELQKLIAEEQIKYIVDHQDEILERVKIRLKKIRERVEKKD